MQRAPGPHYDDLGMMPHPMKPFVADYPHPIWANSHPLRTPIGVGNEFLVMQGYRPDVHPGYRGGYAYQVKAGKAVKSGRAGSPKRNVPQMAKPNHPPWQSHTHIHRGPQAPSRRSTYYY